MRIIVAGCRNVTDEKTVERILSGYIAVKDVVITGGCRGVDQIAHDWAHRMFAKNEVHQADWETHGKAAGPMRNRQMAEDADLLVAFWDGMSRGTKNMIEVAFARRIETHVHFVPTGQD